MHQGGDEARRSDGALTATARKLAAAVPQEDASPESRFERFRHGELQILRANLETVGIPAGAETSG